MENEGIGEEKKNMSFEFSVPDEKINLIEKLSEYADFFAASSEIEIIKQKEQNLLPSIYEQRSRPSYLRRSLAWDSAFFNSAGVLDDDELSFMNKGFRRMQDVRDRRSDNWFEIEPSMYNSCEVSSVFDKNPEPGFKQEALKNVVRSSRNRMKYNQTLTGKSMNVQRDGKTKKDLSGKCNLKACSGRKNLQNHGSLSSPKSSSLVSPSINKSIRASSPLSSTLSKRKPEPRKCRKSAPLATSKIWKNAEWPKSIYSEPNDAKQEWCSLPSPSSHGTHCVGSLSSAKTIRQSGLRPPSPRMRFFDENSPVKYHGPTRSRKVALKASDKLKSPCLEVDKNIKRPKTELANCDQENGKKKNLCFCVDHLDNLSRYFEAIDLNTRTPLADKTSSCNFNGTEPKKDKLVFHAV